MTSMRVPQRCAAAQPRRGELQRPRQALDMSFGCFKAAVALAHPQQLALHIGCDRRHII